MNLGLCIANLLRRYPAVEVPGIGVFKITRIPASYDDQQAAYLPPVNHVELTGGQAEGFPITTYLQLQAGVDEQTAVRMLDSAVAEVMDAISRNGRALLDGLGYLLADGASFVFRPFEANGFGWAPAKKPILVEKEPVAIPDSGEVEPKAAIETEGDSGLEEHPAKRGVTRWVVAAVLLAFVSATGLAWYYKREWFDGVGIDFFSAPKEKAQDLPVGESPSGPKSAAAVTGLDSATVDTEQMRDISGDSVEAQVDSTAVVPAPAKPSVTYEIIVGSFATMAQAKKYVAEMKAKGYDLHAIDSRMPGNRKKISWGSFATEEEAYRELARVQKNFEPGAWIAKIEHNQ